MIIARHFTIMVVFEDNKAFTQGVGNHEALLRSQLYCSLKLAITFFVRARIKGF